MSANDEFSSPVPEAEPFKIAIGDAVFVGNHSDRVGIVAYIGPTQFAQGEWIGIKLKAPNGKNDGSVNGVRYFECDPEYGLFTRRGFLKPVTESAEATPTKAVKPTSLANPPSMVAPRMNEVPGTPESPAVRSNGSGYKVGDRVKVSGSRAGTIRFIGPTDFAAGEWIGVELDDPLGKNDGSVMGQRYFACKPNHGLFSLSSKIAPLHGKTPSRPLRRTGSRESLLSMGSNFSSVSRQRPRQDAQGHRMQGGGSRTSFGGPSIHALESVVKEKEAHIEQLLQEFEMERAELAKITTEREIFETEFTNQRGLVGQLQGQIEELQAAATQLSNENAKLKERVHEEVKKSEELQFRLEEEAIDKTALENEHTDTEERIFELEEALAAARETNERIEAQLREANATALVGASGDESPPESVAKLAEAEARAAALEVSLKELQSKLLNDDAKKQIEAKDAELQQLQTQLTNLQDNLLKAEQRLAEQTSAGGNRPDDNAELSAVNASEVELSAAVSQQQAILTSEAERNRSDEVNALVNKLAQAESDVEAARAKVKELEELLMTKEQEAKSASEHREQEPNLDSFDPERLLEELGKRVASEQEAISKDATNWPKRLIEMAEEMRKLTGLESEAEEATTAALQQMSIKLLEAEAELAQKESESLAQMAQITEAELRAQEAANSASATQTLVIEELRKRLEVLEAERCHLATSLADKQQETIRLHETLAQKASEHELYSEKLVVLEQQLARALQERDEKLDKLKVALDSPAAMELTDDELLRRIELLKQTNEKLEHQFAGAEARVKSLTSQQLQVEDEIRTLKLSTASASAVDEQIAAMQRALQEANYRVDMAERSSAAAIQQLESKSLELQSLQERLLKVAKEHEDFQDKQLQLVTNLETEKRICMERVRRAEKKVERFEKEAQGKTSHVPSSPSPASNGRGLARTPTDSTRESNEGQVNFLNSIIVDLHAKNAKLEQQLREAIEIPKSTAAVAIADKASLKATKAKERLRFWCDNCEVFDLHDTDDCPNEPTLSAGRAHISPHLAKHPAAFVERKYCDNCGLFDLHSTEECVEDPQETF